MIKCKYILINQDIIKNRNNERLLKLLTSSDWPGVLTPETGGCCVAAGGGLKVGCAGGLKDEGGGSKVGWS